MWWAIICWKTTHLFFFVGNLQPFCRHFRMINGQWNGHICCFADLIWIFWGHNSGLKSFIKSAKKIAMESLPSGDWYVYVVKFWGQCGNSKSGMFFAQQSSSELVIQGIKTKIWAPTSCIVHHCPTSHPKSQHDQLLQSRANVFYHVVAILTPKSPFLLMAGIYQPSPNGWMIPILWVTI